MSKKLINFPFLKKRYEKYKLSESTNRITTSLLFTLGLVAFLAGKTPLYRFSINQFSILQAIVAIGAPVAIFLGIGKIYDWAGIKKYWPNIIEKIVNLVKNIFLIAIDSVLSVLTLREFSLLNVAAGMALSKKFIGGRKGLFIGLAIGTIHTLTSLLSSKVAAELVKFLFDSIIIGFFKPIVKYCSPLFKKTILNIFQLTDAKLNSIYAKIANQFEDKAQIVKQSFFMIAGFGGLIKLGIETSKMGFAVAPFLLHFTKQVTIPLASISVIYCGVKIIQYLFFSLENEENIRPELLKNVQEDVQLIYTGPLAPFIAAKKFIELIIPHIKPYVQRPIEACEILYQNFQDTQERFIQNYINIEVLPARIQPSAELITSIPSRVFNIIDYAGDKVLRFLKV